MQFEVLSAVHQIIVHIWSRTNGTTWSMIKICPNHVLSHPHMLKNFVGDDATV